MDKEAGLKQIEDAEWLLDPHGSLNLYVFDQEGRKVHSWLAPRPPYCGRGHIQLFVDGYLGIDVADSFPRFFFSFEEADKHTRNFLRWRIWQTSATPHPFFPPWAHEGTIAEPLKGPTLDTATPNLYG